MRLVFLLIVGFLVGAASTALAQERQLGFKAGVNAAALSSDDDIENGYGERRVGVVAGGFAVLPVRGRLALQFEALFSQKGAKQSAEEEDLTATLELDYLDFPILARLAGPALDSTRLHVFAGPSVSYRMGAHSRLVFTGFDFAQGSAENIEEDVSLFNFGVVAGVGADIGRRLVVDVRYTWGLSNVFKDTVGDATVKHRVLSLMAGVRF